MDRMERVRNKMTNLYAEVEILTTKLDLITDQKEYDLVCVRLEELNCEIELNAYILEINETKTKTSLNISN